MPAIHCFCLFALPGILFSNSFALACEPVVPFMQVMVPALALTKSILVFLAAVVFKSVLFGFFEQRIPHFSAAWKMFLGNVLTSFVGILVALMIASGPVSLWLLGVPIVCTVCWLPARRLVSEAPLAWMKLTSPLGIAAAMTVTLLASCIFFVVGQGAIHSHRLALYWLIKVVAIFLALLASLTLTTIWEEWVIWRLSSRPQGTNYFVTVLRTNLYVLMLVMAVPAALILPTRLKSPDFLAHLLKGAL
jgi:hypothetical protein